jgi:GntR family transcriptional regulator/MocR family aminotransferase
LARWKLSLTIDIHSQIPLYLQVAKAITADICRGRLQPGTKLPGSRSLARSLQVSRNTVAAAYGELAAEGWITSRGSGGTFVSGDLPQIRVREGVAPPRRWSRIGFDLRDLQASRPLAGQLAPDVQSWDFGVPDVRLAPTRAFTRAYRRVLRHHARRVLQYDRYAGQGPAPLERALASMLSATRGLAVDPANLVVTRGSQMALYLVALALIRPGDVVAVEDPGYFLAWDVFRALGARLVPVPVDREGLRVDELREVLRRHRVRAVLLTPHHQFPTTVTLSTGRRLELIQLASAGRFALIEDDYDHEFHYEGRPVQPMASMDDRGVLIYIGTLSKVLAPGLRSGYLVAPTALVRQIGQLRRLVDLQGDLAFDHALAELFEEGELQRCLNRSRRIYRRRRDCLAEALRRELGGVVAFDVPCGGIALWIEVDPAVDVEAWAARARAAGLVFRTGGVFFFSPASQPFIRLGFARFDEQELVAAVGRLVRALPRRRG